MQEKQKTKESQIIIFRFFLYSSEIQTRKKKRKKEEKSLVVEISEIYIIHAVSIYIHLYTK